MRSAYAFWTAMSIACTVANAIGQERPMQLAKLKSVELEYELQGTGDPVVLVHAGVFPDWFEPLMVQPALADHFRLVRYHRVGYAGSSRATTAPSIGDQAEHLRALMRYLGIDRAHIVGHSSGADIAIEFALIAPDMVASLALLEPALPAQRSDGPVQSATPRSSAAMDRYRAADKAGAVDAFLQIVAGPNYRAALDKALPDAFAHGVRDADTFFTQELPAVQQWSFDPESAKKITQPVLAVMGEKSRDVSPIWAQRQQMLLDLLPNAEGFELRGAAHLLYLEQPAAMAQALAAFMERNPLK